MIRKIIAFILIMLGMVVMVSSDQPLIAWGLIGTGLGFYGWALAFEDVKRKRDIDVMCKGV